MINKTLMSRKMQLVCNILAPPPNESKPLSIPQLRSTYLLQGFLVQLVAVPILEKDKETTSKVRKGKNTGKGSQDQH